MNLSNSPRVGFIRVIVQYKLRKFMEHAKLISEKNELSINMNNGYMFLLGEGLEI
jgi:hypothetical protein